MTVRALITAACVVLAACSGRDDFPRGTWVSQSVMHPSPFFRDVLTGKGPGAVELTFRRNGTFLWKDTAEGMELNGTYRVERDRLILETDRETVRVKYTRKKDVLKILTPDDFTFTFRKEQQ